MSEGAVTMATEEETMTAAENGPREWAMRMLTPGHAVILDTETSDLDGSILEVAVIDAATGAVLLDTLVDPGDVQIHPAAAAVHGISAAQLIGAPGWPTVFSALAAVTVDRVVLAYNAEFDQSHSLDPLHLADTERWGCVMVKRSQAEGVEKNIRLDGAHRACGDAEAARTVLQGIADGPTGTPAPYSCA
ncbi:putative exonuclease [Rhodococcus wratislaviensis]|uniref:Putative exonuclease n=2 Tax=Rhodococcus wratislaviensis TaxID=44752 RepID=A0A402C2V5_RHOWR|nr:putative exonuclease [Rhodococcus wratislaviensis]